MKPYLVLAKNKDEKALKNYLDKPWELVAAVSLGWPSEKEKNIAAPKRMPVDEVSEFL
ncbi:MAG: hypothetical protein V3V84_03385 [Candidatus Bathyarchaeia archaeon]